MKIKDLIVIGAGNPDIVRLIEDINKANKKFNFLGFLEKDGSLHGLKRFGYPVLGGDELLTKKKFQNVFIINNVFASVEIRHKVLKSLTHIQPERFVNLIHPTALVRESDIGFDNIIYENVVLQANVTIGNHNIIHCGTVIGHQTIIGNCCLFSVHVSIGARVKIENNSFFGMGCIIIGECKLKESVFVGAGSVVLNNIDSNWTYFGNPAKKIFPRKNNY